MRRNSSNMKMSQEEKKEEKNMAHLEERNRIEIEHYLNNGFSIQDIARFLKVAPSTISKYEDDKSK